jgi:hypothetical protein
MRIEQLDHHPNALVVNRVRRELAVRELPEVRQAREERPELILPPEIMARIDVFARRGVRDLVAPFRLVVPALQLILIPPQLQRFTPEQIAGLYFRGIDTLIRRQRECPIVLTREIWIFEDNQGMFLELHVEKKENRLEKFLDFLERNPNVRWIARGF